MSDLSGWLQSSNQWIYFLAVLPHLTFQVMIGEKYCMFLR